MCLKYTVVVNIVRIPYFYTGYYLILFEHGHHVEYWPFILRLCINVLYIGCISSNHIGEQRNNYIHHDE